MSEKLGRILAFDYGDRRIGIAVTDEYRILASPVETYKTISEDSDLKYLTQLVNGFKPSIVVFGLPLNMDGTENQRTGKTREFAEKIGKTVSCKIDFVDERLTSVEAEEILHYNNVKKNKKKQVLDQVAAVLILESYMRLIKNKGV